MSLHPPVDTPTHLGITERESITEKTRQDNEKRVEQFKRQSGVDILSLRAAKLVAILVAAFDKLYLAGLPFTACEKRALVKLVQTSPTRQHQRVALRRANELDHDLFRQFIAQGSGGR